MEPQKLDKHESNLQQINIKKIESLDDELIEIKQDLPFINEPIVDHEDLKQQILDLQNHLNEDDVIVSLSLNNTELFVSQHTIENNVSFDDVCSEFVEINHLFWNQEYINDNFRNISKIQCIETKLNLYSHIYI